MTGVQKVKPSMSECCNCECALTVKEVHTIGRFVYCLTCFTLFKILHHYAKSVLRKGIA